MKRCAHLYIILTVSLIITLKITSGYTATAIENEVPEIDKLFRYKCSLCHELPDIDAYSSYEHWINVMNAMHEPGRYNESVNAEDGAKIKEYLKTMSQKE